MSQNLGMLGTCARRKVGAIITRDGRAISWGYNGALAGMPHCDENAHGYHPEMNMNRPCLNTVHAEANCIYYAARQGISTDGGTIYVESSPCYTCAQAVIAAGIVRVVFAREYRDPAGLHLLMDAGLRIDRGV
jgi:dCMP deaminase